jgi:protein ImuB
VLALYRTDGEVVRLAVRTSAPSREAAHFMRLFKEHLDKVDPGLGIDLVILSATRTEPYASAQASLAKTSSVDGEALTQLIDRLSSRLGEGAIVRAHGLESHIPERAEVLTPALHDKPQKLTLRQARNEARKPLTPSLSKDDGASERARPFRLFDRPEPIAVMAEVPDGPPLRFTWRRLKHEVVRAAGPERIAPEWWRQDAGAEPLRDYYEIEDREGHRFWVFRSGLYGETGRGSPAWFIHGLG